MNTLEQIDQLVNEHLDTLQDTAMNAAVEMVAHLEIKVSALSEEAIAHLQARLRTIAEAAVEIAIECAIECERDEAADGEVAS